MIGFLAVINQVGIVEWPDHSEDYRNAGERSPGGCLPIEGVTQVEKMHNVRPEGGQRRY